MKHLLLSLFVLALFLSGCGEKTHDNEATADTLSARDSVPAPSEPQPKAPADPRSLAALTQEINAWTATRDQRLAFSDSLAALQDSVERLSYETSGDKYFKKDPWYNRMNYDEDGRDSLVEITSYTDTVAIATIGCLQFHTRTRVTVTLRYNAARRHWEIDDFRTRHLGSMRQKCLEGIHAFNDKLRARREAQREAYLEEMNNEE